MDGLGTLTPQKDPLIVLPAIIKMQEKIKLSQSQRIKNTLDKRFNFTAGNMLVANDVVFTTLPVKTYLNLLCEYMQGKLLRTDPYLLSIDNQLSKTIEISKISCGSSDIIINSNETTIEEAILFETMPHQILIRFWDIKDNHTPGRVVRL